MNAYSTKYEEVQTFSPTFNSFQSELVERLIEKHGIQGKNVVEIGCGKGEFLLELCDRGDNSGVGIDPSFVAGRGDWNAAGRCRFINELYSAERHGDLPADVIVCRHTLEHIHPTREFIQTIRRAIGDDLDTLVFMEDSRSGTRLRRARVLGHLLRALLLFHPGRTGPAVSRLRFRDTRFEEGLWRPISSHRGAPPSCRPEARLPGAGEARTKFGGRWRVFLRTHLASSEVGGTGSISGRLRRSGS